MASEIRRVFIRTSVCTFSRMAAALLFSTFMACDRSDNTTANQNVMPLGKDCKAPRIQISWPRKPSSVPSINFECLSSRETNTGSQPKYEIQKTTLPRDSLVHEEVRLLDWPVSETAPANEVLRLKYPIIPEGTSFLLEVHTEMDVEIGFSDKELSIGFEKPEGESGPLERLEAGTYKLIVRQK